MKDLIHILADSSQSNIQLTQKGDKLKEMSDQTGYYHPKEKKWRN